ncbi:MAG: MMPL family transporter, partial [Desulfurivibrionaceae bacterium]
MLSRSLIIKIILLVVTLIGIYFSLRIELGEDALDMLPGTSLQGDFELLQQLGMVNRIFISLELPAEADPAPDPDPALLASARALGEDLSASPLFDEVFYQLPEGYQFRLAAEVRKYLPALADGSDLRRFEALMKPEVLREKLGEAFQTLNSPAGLAMRRQIQGDPLGFTTVILEKMSTLRGSLRLNIHDGFFIGNDGRHCLLWAESAIPLTASGNAARVNQRLEEALARTLQDRVKARIIGPLPHTLANAGTIRSDLARLLPFAVVVLVVFLLLFLRDWRALFLIAIPFLAAPPAVALLAGVYGRVSAMALGFGIVLLGIGVDFAVHIYIGAGSDPAAGKIPRDLRRSLLMALLTTVGVFGVLLLSRVPAHRQMALLGIIGLSWAFVLAWQLAPALAAKGGVFTLKELPFTRVTRLLGEGGRQRPVKLSIWLLFLTAGLSVWPSLRYNGDLRALDVSDPAVKEDERAFKGIWGGEEEQAFVVAVAKTQARVLNINDRVYQILARQGRISGVQSLAVLLPGP